MVHVKNILKLSIMHSRMNYFFLMMILPLHVIWIAIIRGLWPIIHDSHSVKIVWFVITEITVNCHDLSDLSIIILKYNNNITARVHVYECPWWFTNELRCPLR